LNQESPSSFSVIVGAGMKILVVIAAAILAHVAVADARGVTVGVPVLDVTQSTLFIAHDKGYYRREGLEVDLILMRGAAANR
jgi:ABC-type nitrate/sulfonate/bicarbonate transport system substrate-binding protein